MTGAAEPGVSLWLTALGVVTAAAVSYGSILQLWPWLKRYALARPNARSSHRVPTPQGGGMAVVGSVLLVTTVLFAVAGLWPSGQPAIWAAVAAATLILAMTGAVDDLRELGPLPRLGLQVAAVGLVLAVMPAELRVVSVPPLWLERIVLLLAGLWFVNLVNFMDGIDWITVAEVVPVTAALVLLGALGALPPTAILAAGALCGAVLGFAPFNRPVAKLFLGDVGSLPVGLLLAWLLFLLATGGHLAAAVLLPLYYLADASLTLIVRLARRQPLFQAHRDHFYQRAIDRGVAVPAIVGRIFVVNVGLSIPAAASVLIPTPLAGLAALSCGVVLVAVLLWQLACARPR